MTMMKGLQLEEGEKKVKEVHMFPLLLVLQRPLETQELLMQDN